MRSDYKFVAQLENLKVIVQLLKAVNIKQFATCFCSSDGLKITVEDSKCVQTSAYLPKGIFKEYTLLEDIIMKINLNVLVECLGMFWSSMSMQVDAVVLQIFYKGDGHPVTVLIEEDGVITECSLKTLEPDELLDFQMDPQSILNKVIFKADLLKDVWGELDPTTEFIQVLLSPTAPFFRISTDGLSGECRIELPHDSDMFDTFQCKDESVFFYKFSHIKLTMKALVCASKISLRTDKDGLLCFQYMVKTEEGSTCFVEYYVLPVVDID